MCSILLAESIEVLLFLGSVRRRATPLPVSDFKVTTLVNVKIEAIPQPDPKHHDDCYMICICSIQRQDLNLGGVTFFFFSLLSMKHKKVHNLI